MNRDKFNQSEMLLAGWTHLQFAHAIGDCRAAGMTIPPWTTPRELNEVRVSGGITDCCLRIMEHWRALSGEDAPMCAMPPKDTETEAAARLFELVFKELESKQMIFRTKPERQPMTDPTEQLIAAADANKAPRVTPADIETQIESEHYFTAAQGVLGAIAADGVPATAYERANAAPAPLSLLTFCVLVMRNGFTVTGESACASPETFNADVGRKVARQNAVDKIWPLLGYELRTRLTQPAYVVLTSPAPGQNLMREIRGWLNQEREFQKAALDEDALAAHPPVVQQEDGTIKFIEPGAPMEDLGDTSKPRED